MPDAVRSRVLRSAALAAGCPAGALTAGHVARLEELVTGWHGQRWIDLPGGVRASRQNGQLCFAINHQHKVAEGSRGVRGVAPPGRS